jgi:hypothetical protein
MGKRYRLRTYYVIWRIFSCLAVFSAGEYEFLKRGDRRVIRAGELTEDEMIRIAQAEVPAEHAHLDAELKDWHP